MVVGSFVAFCLIRHWDSTTKESFFYMFFICLVRGRHALGFDQFQGYFFGRIAQAFLK
jgi:hypothetical protein